MTDLQKAQFEILKDFGRVCAKNRLIFYLAYGTCIGAMRHHGFIPWDDDIDIMMTVDEIEKFKKVADELKPNVYFQSHDKEREYGLMIYRIRNSETTLIEEDHMDRDINHGVYIDIYPLMNSYNSKIEKIKMRVAMLFCRLFVYNAPPRKKGNLYKVFAQLILFITPQFLKDSLSDRFNRYLCGRKPCGRYCTIFTISRGTPDYPAVWFEEPTYLDFEGVKMPVPSKVHEYLSTIYGDYMQLPPEDKRCLHHTYLFADIKNSYVKYKGVKYCIDK